MGRGAKPVAYPRGIDLFNAQAEEMKKQASEQASGARPPATARASGARPPAAKKETPEEYKARHELLATRPPAAKKETPEEYKARHELLATRPAAAKKETPEEYKARHELLAARPAAPAQAVSGQPLAAKKETPEEYKARHELLATIAHEREKTKKLRAIKHAFRRECLDHGLCLNCGWPGHRMQNCPEGTFAPVWDLEKQDWTFVEQPKVSGALEAYALAGGRVADMDENKTAAAEKTNDETATDDNSATWEEVSKKNGKSSK